MIKAVTLGEEIVIVTKNKIGLLADITSILADYGINIEAVNGYETGDTATIMLITNANLSIISELRKAQYKTLKEAEVILVELENKPGALKTVTTELKVNDIDIKHLYITSCSRGGSSKMVLHTSDNEKAMALLAQHIRPGEEDSSA